MTTIRNLDDKSSSSDDSDLPATAHHSKVGSGQERWTNSRSYCLSFTNPFTCPSIVLSYSVQSSFGQEGHYPVCVKPECLTSDEAWKKKVSTEKYKGTHRTRAGARPPATSTTRWFYKNKEKQGLLVNQPEGCMSVVSRSDSRGSFQDAIACRLDDLECS
jgi:hypothetical protein